MRPPLSRHPPSFLPALTPPRPPSQLLSRSVCGHLANNLAAYSLKSRPASDRSFRDCRRPDRSLHIPCQSSQFLRLRRPARLSMVPVFVCQFSPTSVETVRSASRLTLPTQRAPGRHLRDKYEESKIPIRASTASETMSLSTDFDGPLHRPFALRPCFFSAWRRAVQGDRVLKAESVYRATNSPSSSDASTESGCSPLRLSKFTNSSFRTFRATHSAYAHICMSSQLYVVERGNGTGRRAASCITWNVNTKKFRSGLQRRLVRVHDVLSARAGPFKPQELKFGIGALAAALPRWRLHGMYMYGTGVAGP
ncbi:hypothetical protein C8Q78DRAFT_1033123 [Trametes maxima]|nr:hypothetical protein C8Q78DRAFT_1033123 [Trametes maxima]